MATAVDIGSEAIERLPGGAEAGWTIVLKDNPANLSGKITSVELFVSHSLEGAVIKTLYTTNGNVLKCRDSVAVGDVASGSKQTIPDLNLSVEAGDYIGIFFTAGLFHMSEEGYPGLWAFFDGEIDVDDEETFDFFDGFTISLKGVGVTAAYYHGLKVQGVGELALCDVGNSPLRIRKGGVTYGMELVDISDPNASAIRIKTGAGIKAIRKYT